MVSWTQENGKKMKLAEPVVGLAVSLGSENTLIALLVQPKKSPLVCCCLPNKKRDNHCLGKQTETSRWASGSQLIRIANDARI